MNNQEIGELDARIEAHPGKRILGALAAYTFSRGIFSGNAQELSRLATQFEDLRDPLKIEGVDRHARLDSQFGELARRLHNFAAGGKTIVDHTKMLLNEDFVTGAFRDEQRECMEAIFGREPLPKFVQELRNHVVHNGLPRFSLEWTFEPQGKMLTLDLDGLVAERNWSAPARSYMVAHMPSVRVLDLVSSYEQQVNSFHSHFFESFKFHFRNSVEEVIRLITELNVACVKVQSG